MLKDLRLSFLIYIRMRMRMHGRTLLYNIKPKRALKILGLDSSPPNAHKSICGASMIAIEAFLLNSVKWWPTIFVLTLFFV